MTVRQIIAVTGAGMMLALTAGCGDQSAETAPVITSDDKGGGRKPAQRPPTIPEAQRALDTQRAKARKTRRSGAQDAKSAEQITRAYMKAATWLAAHHRDKLSDVQRAAALTKRTGVKFAAGARPEPGQGAVQTAGQVITVRLLTTGNLSRVLRVQDGAVLINSAKPPKGYKPRKAKIGKRPKLTAAQRAEANFERQASRPVTPAADKKSSKRKTAKKTTAKKTADDEKKAKQSSSPDSRVPDGAVDETTEPSDSSAAGGVQAGK